MRIEDIQFYQLRPCRTKRRKKIRLKAYYEGKIAKENQLKQKVKRIKQLSGNIKL